MEFFVTGILIGLAFLLRGGSSFSGSGYGGSGSGAGSGYGGSGSGSGAGSRSGTDSGCGCGGNSGASPIIEPAPLAPFSEVTAPGSSWGRPGGMGPGYSSIVVSGQYGA